VQLYTSKSYESRRSELVNPPEAAESPTASGNNGALQRQNSTENLNKHVLSPQLVDAISKTTQVVWANTKKREGLNGRSDIPLQTAVGMPVAVDENGNMCVVVMFSPHNIQSSDEAMEYLQSISQSATSSSIPCLLPVCDPNSSNAPLLHAPHVDPAEQPLIPHPDASALGEGVTARFVSLDDIHPKHGEGILSTSDEPEVHSAHELASAPKDTFGIPMLPCFAELGNSSMSITPEAEDYSDVFDEASYGIWSTIMQPEPMEQSQAQSSAVVAYQGEPSQPDFPPMGINETCDSTPASWNSASVQADPSLQVMLPDQCIMSPSRIERLEEFCSAFLGMSVFDFADVWVPAASNGYPDCLRYAMSVSSTDKNENLNVFKSLSEHALIKFWTGAVGRAYSSGNPVWSANPSVFVDPGRAPGFDRANIQTVLAVPVFTGKQVLPTCVVACYSLVKSGSVPFVLRFVQQALRLLWDGLDQIEPHESIGRKYWKDVGPADLGEMAADVEMQQHFMSRKRPHNDMSMEASQQPSQNSTLENIQASFLSTQLQSIRLPDGEVISVPLQLSDDMAEKKTPEDMIESVQSHLANAVQSISRAVPFDHADTNPEGTKRAHIGMGPINSNGNPIMPLPMPRGFPNRVLSSASVSSHTSTSTASPMQPPTNIVQPQQHLHAPMLQPLYVPPVTQSATQAIQVQSNFLAAPSAQYAVQKESGGAVQSSGVFCQPISAARGGSENGKICKIDGCDQPSFPKRPYCEKHSGNRICEHPGCPKCAQGCTRFCIAHGGGRRCTFPGCDKGARDKFFCAAHGGGKRCRHEGCTKSAVGGSSFCTAHGGGRRCAVDGCDKSAQSSTKFCVKHGGGKKCAQEGCDKVARGRTSYCAAHGGGVRCKLEGCKRVAIGKMQLCRAHGGTSSRSKKNTNIQPQKPASQPQHGIASTMAMPAAAVQADIFGHTMLQQNSPGVPLDQMTSV